MTLVSNVGENKNLLPIAAGVGTTLNPIQEHSIHDHNIVASSATASGVVTGAEAGAAETAQTLVPLNPSTTNEISPPIIVPIPPIEQVKTVARPDADKNVVVSAKVCAEKRNILSTANSGLSGKENYSML